MGFFDKKYCDICGEKIGLLGNRKLQDGNMCKDCAKKLSPWFTERRETDIAGIKEQLAYREQNKQAVADFNTTVQLGEEMRIYVDEQARKFMITDAHNLEKENPDVFDLDSVTNCSLRIHDSQRELQTKNSRGEMVSYDPPRFEYSVWFHITLNMNHPYVDEISFQLNEYVLKIKQSGGTFLGLSLFDPREDYECRRYIAMAEEICQALTGRPLTNITRS